MAAYQGQTDPTAVMGRRIVAYLIDAAIGVIIAVAVFSATVDYDTLSSDGARRLFGDENLCAAADSVDEGTDFAACTVTLRFPDGEVLSDRFIFYNGDTNYVVKTESTGLVWLVLLGYWFLVYCLWQGASGMTPGKAALGLRTVNEGGQAPGLGKAIIRSLLWVVDGIGCIVPLVAPITAFASKGHRRVGDMAAKTFVVDKESMGAPVVVPGLTSPPAAAAGAPQPWATATPQAPASPPVADAGAGAATGEPQWDPQRNAYIRWDATQQSWLQYDDASGEWRPIQ